MEYRLRPVYSFMVFFVRSCWILLIYLSSIPVKKLENAWYSNVHFSYEVRFTTLAEWTLCIRNVTKCRKVGLVGGVVRLWLKSNEFEFHCTWLIWADWTIIHIILVLIISSFTLLQQGLIWYTSDMLCNFFPG